MAKALLASIPALALFASLAALVMLVVLGRRFMARQRAMEVSLQALDTQLKVLQDSQLGLGRHLLALERWVQEPATMHGAAGQGDGGSNQGGAGQGSLNRIAALLRDGVAPADVVTRLAVSAAEVRLVQMVLQNTETATDDH